MIRLWAKLLRATKIHIMIAFLHGACISPANVVGCQLTSHLGFVFPDHIHSVGVVVSHAGNDPDTAPQTEELHMFQCAARRSKRQALGTSAFAQAPTATQPSPSMRASSRCTPSIFA